MRAILLLSLVRKVGIPLCIRVGKRVATLFVTGRSGGRRQVSQVSGRVRFSAAEGSHPTQLKIKRAFPLRWNLSKIAKFGYCFYGILQVKLLGSVPWCVSLTNIQYQKEMLHKPASFASLYLNATVHVSLTTCSRACHLRVKDGVGVILDIQ